MDKLIISILLFIPFFGCTQKSSTISQKSDSISPKSGLIFQSGFEGNTKIIEQNEKTAEIVGLDNSVSSPNDWVNHLRNHLNIGYFNFQYQGGDKSQRLAEIASDPTNPSNKTLKFWIKEPNVGPKKGRVQANVYNNNEIKEVSYSVRLFLPSDLNAVKSAPLEVKWLTLMEFWNNANWMEEDYQFRLSVNLQKLGDGTDSLHIGVKSQVRDVAADNWKKPYLWDFTNTNFVVPVEKWMTIDILFVEGDAKSGRFKISITPDGEATTVVHDVKNYTCHPDDPAPDGLSHFNPLKLYTSDDLINHVTKSGKLLSVYWDDFKLSINDTE